MERDVYRALVRAVDLPVLCCPALQLLAARHRGVSPDTICAILSQEAQYKVIKSHHLHKAAMHSYCSRYVHGEDVLGLCAEVDFPPCLMIRRMLELMLRLSKQRVSEVLRDPRLLYTMNDRTACLSEWLPTQQEQQQQLRQQQQHKQDNPQPKGQEQQQQQVQQQKQEQQEQEQQQQQQQEHQQQLQQFQEQQQLSQEHRQLQAGPAVATPQQGAQSPAAAALLSRLVDDVCRCVAADRSYSPYCDLARSLAGLEHEARLYECLQAAGIAFWSEEQLRARGMFKTPDALLQVPICVRAARAGRSGPGWAVVHWIDSKASFGDDRTHGQQLEGQYRTYTNRYGPGLVIYWFGFLSDLDNDADVALTDAFPGPGSLYQLPRLAGPTGAAGSLVSPSPAPAGRGGGTKAAALPHGADDGVEAIAARAAKLSLGDEQRAQILPSVPQALVL